MSTGLESIIIVLAQSINRYEYQLIEQNMSTIQYQYQLRWHNINSLMESIILVIDQKA